MTVQFIRPFYEALARSSATQRQFDSHVKVLSPLCCDKTLYSASGHQKLPLQEEPAVKVQECRRGHLQTGQPSLYASRIKPCVDFSHSCRMGFNEPISSFLALRQLDIHDYSDFNWHSSDMSTRKQKHDSSCNLYWILTIASAGWGATNSTRYRLEHGTIVVSQQTIAFTLMN